MRGVHNEILCSTAELMDIIGVAFSNSAMHLSWPGCFEGERLALGPAVLDGPGQQDGMIGRILALDRPRW
jgi:hypothetical protein